MGAGAGGIDRALDVTRGSAIVIASRLRMSWRVAPTILAALLLAAAPRLAAAQPKSAHALAEEQFKQGREAMARGEIQRALTLLEASHKAEPGRGKLLNIALCEEQLGKLKGALAKLEELAPQLPAGDDRAAIVAQHLASVRAALPRLRVELAAGSPSGAGVMLDGEPVSAGGELRVDPGHHVLSASAPGAAPFRLELDLAPGAQRRVTVAFPTETDAAPAPARPLSFTLGIAGVSAGGAALLAGLGVGGAALGKRGRLSTACSADHACPPSSADTIRAYHTLGGASTGLILGGALLAAGGAALMLLQPGRKAAATGWITPEIGLGSASVRGSF